MAYDQQQRTTALAAAPKSNGGMVREEFGAIQTNGVIEQASSALAARETALVQARFVMAMQRKRSLENVRVLLKQACEIFEFADEAWYSRPAGKKKNEQTGQWEESFAEGFSIRFAEEAGRTMGNLLSDSQIVAETFEERLVHVWAMDLETNFTRGLTISVPKIVERKYLKDGQEALAERTNSRGDKTFTVQATASDLSQTQANMVAKAERQCLLKMLPAWIQAECRATIINTLQTEISKDPKAAARKVIDGFAEIQILPSDLQAYLEHTLDRLTEKEIAELRGLYRSIKEGQMTWEEIMQAKDPAGSTKEAQRVAAEKLEKLRREAAAKQPTQTQQPTDDGQKTATDAGGAGDPNAPMSDEENRKADQKLAEEERRASQQGPAQGSGFAFGRNRGGR